MEPEEEQVLKIGTTYIRVSTISAYWEDSGTLYIKEAANDTPYQFAGYTVAQLQAVIPHDVYEVI